MQDATAHPTTRQVSVAEAARELGISTETVRRRIKSGELKAERAIRPQGTAWLVSLPVTTPRGVPPVTGHTGHSEASLSKLEHATPDEAWRATPPVTGHTMDAAPLVASIARLIAELAEVRVVSDRRADQLVSQAETIGELRAEMAELKAAQSVPAAPTTPVVSMPPSLPPAARWRGLRAWLGIGLVVAVVGSVSCQAKGDPSVGLSSGLCVGAKRYLSSLGEEAISTLRVNVDNPYPLRGGLGLWQDIEAALSIARACQAQP